MSMKLGKRPSEAMIAVLALAAIAISLTLEYVLRLPALWYRIPLFIVLAAGGLPLLADLTRKIIARDFGSDLLAGVSIVSAALLGEYLVACIVILMLSGGVALEQFATRRASSTLEALSRRMPSVAHRRHGAALIDVPLGDIKVGQTLVILPHELAPVDGVVIEGDGWMDESYLSGEPYRMPKVRGADVLSGAINGDVALMIEATKLPVDSRYARIMSVMQEAQVRRPRLRRLGDVLGAWYTPLALAIAAAGWIVSGSAYRFLAVVVIATPCPLLLAIPVAVIGAVSLSARRGIIVKDTAMLERIDACRTAIFDKTGTLTYGLPALTDIVCANGVTEHDALVLAASVEQYSKHPLAAAVLVRARADGITLSAVQEITERPGEGLCGTVEGHKVEITGRQTLMRKGRMLPVQVPPSAQGLESIVFVDGSYAALLRFRDEPRSESHTFVQHLTPRHHISRVMVLSGDRESEVTYLAGRIGIFDVHSGKSPEEKVDIVAAETKRAPTLFVGDGINDAPAMQAATVGLAFGQTNEITSESADAVILEPMLGKVDELMHIGRRMRVIALQSALGGMALSTIGMLFAVAGFLPPIAGAIAQEIIDVLAVLNALRVGFPVAPLTDY